MFIALRATNAPLFFPFYALLPSRGVLINVINFAAYYGGYVQLGTSFFVSLNRLTAASAPSRHIRVRASKLSQTLFGYLPDLAQTVSGSDRRGIPLSHSVHVSHSCLWRLSGAKESEQCLRRIPAGR